jgi:hypothetical protein
MTNIKKKFEEDPNPEISSEMDTNNRVSSI